jgi:hypothetical protein
VTALVFLTAAGVLVVGARRALADGGPQAKVSRMLWNQMLPGEGTVSGARFKHGSHYRELVGVLIATSDCGGTRNPDFVPAVRAMKAELARRAAAQGKGLRLVGVAMDDKVSDGMMLLNRIGPFDEISVGGNWLNSNAVAYVWRSSDRSAAVPQWVVLERDVAVTPEAITVAPDRVVAIVAGADRMRAWIRASQNEVPNARAAASR